MVDIHSSEWAPLVYRHYRRGWTVHRRILDGLVLAAVLVRACVVNGRRIRSESFFAVSFELRVLWASSSFVGRPSSSSLVRSLALLWPSIVQTQAHCCITARVSHSRVLVRALFVAFSLCGRRKGLSSGQCPLLLRLDIERRSRT